MLFSSLMKVAAGFGGDEATLAELLLEAGAGEASPAAGSIALRVPPPVSEGGASPHAAAVHTNSGTHATFCSPSHAPAASAVCAGDGGFALCAART